MSTSSPLRYPGGKFRARKILRGFVPDGTANVISPFFGGGSFELFLTEGHIKVYGYDGFRPLSNFWVSLLRDPKGLTKEIKSFGAISSSLFKEMQKYLIENTDNVCSLNDGAKFFIVNRCSFSGATLSGGYSAASSTTRFTPSSIEKISNFNNPYLSVEYGFFEASLSPENVKEKNIDFIFLDPPYLLEKAKNVLYGIGGDLHKTFSHQDLYDLITSTDIPFAITYNDSPEIRKMYKGYRIFDLSWSYGMNATKKSSEIVIINHDTYPKDSEYLFDL